MATTIPTLNSKLWTEFDGKGFSAKHAEYAERASTDVMGHDLTLTMANNQVTAIGGKPISAVAPAEMTGATASTDGESGLVPAPEAGDQDKYLKGDGTWANVPVAVASTSGAGGTDGLMPATDKEKLDGAKSFSTVKVTNGNVSATLPATSLNEDIELVAGDNVTLEAGLVIGGRQYKTVKIGNQVWMAENLDFLPDGIELHEESPADADFATAGAWYYGNDKVTAQSRGYGLLYNTKAVDYLEANKATLFPGWHVPTESDMNALVGNGGSDRRNTMRMPVDWAGSSWDNGAANNSAGFSAIPCGEIYKGSGSNPPYFVHNGSGMEFWSATVNGAGKRYFVPIGGSRTFYVSTKTNIDDNALSIRLVKDDSTFPNKVRISSDAALEKSTYGTYVSSEQGEAVQGESGEISVSENSVELYDTFKGVKFGAARAVADREGNVIDETYATREGATSSEAGLMSAADKSKLDGITDYVVSAEVSGSTLTLTPKTGSAVVFTDTGEANVIESVKLGNDTLTPASKVVTIPMLSSTTNGAVTAPAAANRNHYSFLDGMGDWSMLEEVSEAAINGMFLKVTIDGREYKVVRIGNQEWLAENLDYKFDVNGSPIELNNQSSTPTTPAAWYYNRNEATYGVDGEYKCGLLYNGFAARYLEANKNNLLPNGWHIPTTAEWNTLATACGGASVAGKKLKALNNSITSNWPSNWNGTDDYGFNAIPVGLVQDMDFQLFGTKNHIWSSTENTNHYNYMVTLSSGSDDMYITYYSIYSAMSIRLVKDIT